jgi:hypothetical protein
MTARDCIPPVQREKEIKGWRREKKVALIKRENPTWEDLSAGFFAGEKKQRPKASPPENAKAAETADPSSARKRPLSG